MATHFSFDLLLSFPNGSVIKKIHLQCRRLRFTPWVGRSLEGGNGNPLQYSYLSNPIDRGVWRAIVQRVAKSHTHLSDWAPSLIIRDVSHLFTCLLLTGISSLENRLLRSSAPFYFFVQLFMHPFLFFVFCFFWLPRVFIAVHGFSLVAARRGPSVAVSRLLFTVASLISGNRIWVCKLQLLWHTPHTG